MRLREIFGLVVRLVGLGVAAFGFCNFIWQIEPTFEVVLNRILGNDGRPWMGTIEVISLSELAVLSAAGIWMLRSADRIVSFTYRFDPARPRCEKCGYDLRANKDKCPECGTPSPPPPIRAVFHSLVADR